MENDIRKDYRWYSQKNFRKIAGRLHIFNFEDVININNIAYLQVQKILSATNKFPSHGFFVDL